MANHDLKTHPIPWQDVDDGLKTFEVRNNDRNFQVNDTLTLREWDPQTEDYTGKVCVRKVIYIHYGGSCGLEMGYVVLGLMT